MERRSTSTTTGGTSTSTTQRYYEDTSDNPAWATTTTGNTTETTRYLSSIAGDMSVTKNMDTGFLSAGIIDPQGSVVTTSYAQTLPADTETGTPSQTVTAWSPLQAFDEYGNTLNNVADKLTGAVKYAWLGGKERATDTSGLVLMGVRLYNAITGHFTSVDPVVGGNTTRYSYLQDPINKYDLDGNAWNWAKKAWSWTKKTGARVWRGVQSGGRFLTTNKYARGVLSACSWVPGIVGGACSVTNSLAHMVQGDFRAGASALVGRGVGKGITKGAARAQSRWSSGVKARQQVDTTTRAGLRTMRNYNKNYQRITGRASWLSGNVASMGAENRMTKKRVFW